MSNTSVLNSELFVNLLQEAQFQAYESSIARQLVSIYDVPANSGKVVQIPIWDQVTAELISNEAAATAAGTDTNSQTVTLSEHVVYHRITDMLRDSAQSNVFAQIGDQSGRAIAESMDKQVFALFDGFDDDFEPGASADMTVKDILKAAAVLRSRKLTGPFAAVIHPAQAYALKEELANVGGTGIPSLSNVGNQVLSAGFIGTVSGVMIYESALVDFDDQADTAVGGVFAPQAIAHSMRGSIGMEEQRQAAARATDLVLTAVAGAGLIRPEYGVRMTSAADLSNGNGGND